MNDSNISKVESQKPDYLLEWLNSNLEGPKIKLGNTLKLFRRLAMIVNTFERIPCKIENSEIDSILPLLNTAIKDFLKRPEVKIKPVLPLRLDLQNEQVIKQIILIILICALQSKLKDKFLANIKTLDSKCIKGLKNELKLFQAHHLLNILEQDDISNENHDANDNPNDNIDEKNHIAHSKIISNNKYPTTETTRASTCKNGSRPLDNTEPSKMNPIMRGLSCGIFTSLFIFATAILINYSMI